MDANSEERSRKGARVGRVGFDIFMIIFYIAVGLLCIFQVAGFEIYNPAISYTVGGLLCAYAIWRIVRLVMALKQK